MSAAAFDGATARDPAAQNQLQRDTGDSNA
jgi:hypothetical protein